MNVRQFIKFLTAWTYETELQPVAARAINVEFTVFNPAMDFMVIFNLCSGFGLLVF